MTLSSSLYFLFTGIAGIIWVLFWFNITSDTPENDPLISEEEIIYLENNIPSDHLHELKVSIYVHPYIKVYNYINLETRK